MKVLIRNGFFLIDRLDYPKIKPYSWSRHDHRGYIRGYVNGKVVYLHRFLLNPPTGFQVDHINGNTFDNRRNNLRFATRQQNMWNANGRRKGYKGAHYDKKRKTWIGHITFNRRFILLGKFATEKEAALAYDCAALQLFGIYANTNFKLNRGIRSKNQGALNGTQRHSPRSRQIA